MHWRDIDEIAVQLEEHCNEHYENITLSKMEKLIRELEGFEDIEEDVEEVTLEEILEKWGEIHEEHDEDY
ncbi:MAG: Fe-S cluster assembly protein IscX [Rickettsia endosymbiont of Pentastiridius leporinus]